MKTVSFSTVPPPPTTPPEIPTTPVVSTIMTWVISPLLLLGEITIMCANQHFILCIFYSLNATVSHAMCLCAYGMEKEQSRFPPLTFAVQHMNVVSVIANCFYSKLKETVMILKFLSHYIFKKDLLLIFKYSVYNEKSECSPECTNDPSDTGHYGKEQSRRCFPSDSFYMMQAH